jgi:hypothetical protein
MSIHSMVTLPSLPEPESPQAARKGAAVTTTAPAETAVRNERRDRCGMPMMASWIGGWAWPGRDGAEAPRFEIFSKVFELAVAVEL